MEPKFEIRKANGALLCEKKLRRIHIDYVGCAPLRNNLVFRRPQGNSAPEEFLTPKRFHTHNYANLLAIKVGGKVVKVD